MKLLIDGNYHDVGFWSFLKCNLLTSLMISVLTYVISILILFIIGVTIAR